MWVARKKTCKVFVSYSRHDEGLVKPLAGLLAAAAGEPVFVDVNNLQPGDDWKAGIDKAIRDSPVFILCWCCRCRKSKFIAKEIKLALEQDKKRIIPVRFCSAPLPRSVKSKQWTDLQGKILHNCDGHERPLASGLAAPDDLMTTVQDRRAMDTESLVDDEEATYKPARRSRFAASEKFTVILLAVFAATFDLFRRSPGRLESLGPPESSPHLGVRFWIEVAVCVIGVAWLARAALKYLEERENLEHADELASIASSYFASLGE